MIRSKLSSFMILNFSIRRGKNLQERSQKFLNGGSDLMRKGVSKKIQFSKGIQTPLYPSLAMLLQSCLHANFTKKIQLNSKTLTDILPNYQQHLPFTHLKKKPTDKRLLQLPVHRTHHSMLNYLLLLHFCVFAHAPVR